MRREERVTVQGPVKEQQPDGMSHRGGLRPFQCIPNPPERRAVELSGAHDGLGCGGLPVPFPQTRPPRHPLRQDQIPGAVKMTDGSISLPNGMVVLPDGTVRLPDGSVKLPDGRLRRPDGTFATPNADGTFDLLDGTKLLPDGGLLLQTGAMRLPDNTIIFPDGTIKLPNGTLAPPGYKPPDYSLPCFGRTRRSTGVASGTLPKCEACGKPVIGATRQVVSFPPSLRPSLFLPPPPSLCVCVLEGGGGSLAFYYPKVPHIAACVAMFPTHKRPLHTHTPAPTVTPPPPYGVHICTPISTVRA